MVVRGIPILQSPEAPRALPCQIESSISFLVLDGHSIWKVETPRSFSDSTTDLGKDSYSMASESFLPSDGLNFINFEESYIEDSRISLIYRIPAYNRYQRIEAPACLKGVIGHRYLTTAGKCYRPGAAYITATIISSQPARPLISALRSTTEKNCIANRDVDQESVNGLK
ncbi:hypothetical protein J6590_019327 [Homalodisca vitripennis]|nr:hypothetical protein J6590_019327 [Homalodisca vitripennis]